MRLTCAAEPHLSYCTNVHPGDTWEEVKGALLTHAREVKARVCPKMPMALGLRLSANTVLELRQPAAREELKGLLADNGFYVASLNGFAYGTFHGRAVKTRAYAPDWRFPRRLEYTLGLATLLAELMPVGTAFGAISTVPAGLKRNTRSPQVHKQVARQLVDAAVFLHQLRQKHDKTIVLALEPEAGCLLETTAETIAFFREHLFSSHARARFVERASLSEAEAETALRRHLGVCFDACHAAIQFEDAPSALKELQSAGIRVGKLQLSSALEASPDQPEDRVRLEQLADDVYLHQVVEKWRDHLRRFLDLPEALTAPLLPNGARAWRLHYHVPIFLPKHLGLRTTQPELAALLAWLRNHPVTAHLEVETHTWNLLPSDCRPARLSDGIAQELEWARAQLAGPTSQPSQRFFAPACAPGSSPGSDGVPGVAGAAGGAL